MPAKVKKFPAEKLIAWQKECGRNNLPWQATTDPYLRWIAEKKLQQTHVGSAKPYYEKFAKRFPTVKDFAEASESDVFVQWGGLGYYNRARNAHKAAKKVVEEYNGEFPVEVSELVKLPGIGLSTAGAVVSAATDKPEPIFDGNVKRAFARFFAIDEIYGTAKFEKLIHKYAQESLPAKDGRAYSQGLMDLGAMVCVRTHPRCMICPVSDKCKAFNKGETEKYPVKPKKKPLPVKETNWLVGYDQGKVFLHHLEGKGVWGGLWTFPATEEIPKDFIKPLKVINHSFSHYKINFHPYLVSPLSFKDMEGKWFSKEESQNIGVASPVRTFLDKLFETGDDLELLGESPGSDQ